MKKIILVAALVLGFAAAAAAQPRAIGIRGGFGAGVSYQHTVGANFIDVDLGFGNGLNLLQLITGCLLSLSGQAEVSGVFTLVLVLLSVLALVTQVSLMLV